LKENAFAEGNEGIAVQSGQSAWLRMNFLGKSSIKKARKLKRRNQ